MQLWNNAGSEIETDKSTESSSESSTESSSESEMEGDSYPVYAPECSPVSDN